MTTAKTALVTGANTGMGFETAKALARSGHAVVLACRSLDKAQQARDRIKIELPSARIEAVQIDLSDLDSVRSFGEKAQRGGQPLDILCNNAGIMACPEMRTQEGYEMQLAVNHLGHFLLTSLLLPLMMGPQRPARILNVSSSAHMLGRINFDDLQSRRSYSAWGAYSQSKLANVLFTYELARRIPHTANITVNAVHPGIVATELQRHIISPNPPWWQLPFLYAARPFLKSPQQGAATAIHLCTSPEVAEISSKYWVDCKPVRSSAASYDTEAAGRLWEVSQQLTQAPNFLGTAEVAAQAF